MGAKVETESFKYNGLKWTIALSLLTVAIVGFYYFADYSQLLRVIVLLAAAGVCAAILVQTDKGHAAWEFMRDARTEARKVVWPTRKETSQTTLIVIAMVAVMSIILWLLDMFLAWAVKSIIGG